MKSKAYVLILSLLLSLFLLLSANVVGNQPWDASVFYQGDVLFNLEPEYSAGEPLKTDIKVRNLESFPLFNAALVIEVVAGESQHTYPSTLSDKDNVFYEEVISGIDIPAGSEMTVPFSYMLPEDLASGTYRLDVYLRTERTPIIGIPHIFISPKYKSFKVSGAGNFPYAMFVRNSTVFAGQKGQVGPGVEGGKQVSGDVYVRCGRGASGDLKVYVLVCAWDDTLCAGKQPLLESTYDVEGCGVNNLSKVSVQFNAPMKPDAYAIRLELKDGDRMLSLYRSRIIVTGEAVKIRKMNVDRASYRAGEKGIVSVLVSGSPDHYTNPLIKNVQVSAYLIDDGEEVYRSSVVVPELSGDMGLVGNNFTFEALKDLDGFTVCSDAVSKEGYLFDRYCYNVSSFGTEAKEPRIIVNWSYDPKASSLHVKMCSEDDREQIDASAMVMRKHSGVIDGIKDKIRLAPCAEISLQTPGGDVLLFATNLKTNTQYRFNLSLPVGEPVRSPVCGDGICDSTEAASCCTDCECSAGLECRAGGCVEEKPEKKPDSLYMYAGVVLVLLGLAVLFFRMKQSKKPKLEDKIK